MPGVEGHADARQVDRRRRTPVPRQLLQPLDPVVGLLGAGLRRLAQTAALASDGVPHGRGQPVGGALAEHASHDRRRDDLGRPGVGRPARQRVAAYPRQLRLELRHARLARVDADYLADRRPLEADDARGRRRPPRLGGGPRRLRGQRLQLRHRRHVALDQRDIGDGMRYRGGRLRRQRRRRPGDAGLERALQQVLFRDGQLFLLGVPRKLDHLQPGAHGLRDRFGIGRRHDPEDRGQVERNLDVVVLERGAAHGVENVAQRLGHVGPHPVDGLEEEDRVPDPGLAQAAEDASRGLVLVAAEPQRRVVLTQGHAHVGADRLGGGQRQRRLPRP